MDRQLSFESLCVWVSIYIMLTMWSVMFTVHAQGANGMRECIGDVEQIADDVYLAESDDSIYLWNSFIGISLSRTTGSLSSLFNGSTFEVVANMGKSEQLTWQADGKSIGLNRTGRFIAYDYVDLPEGVRFDVHSQVDGLDLTQTFVLYQGEPLIRREIRLYNATGKATRVDGMSFSINGIPVDKGGEIWQFRTFALVSNKRDETLGVFYVSAQEYYDTELITSTVSHSVMSNVAVLGKLNPDDTWNVGAQYITLHDGTILEAKQQIHHWLELAGYASPSDTASWAEDAVIYSIQPGGHIESWFTDLGGFQNLERTLPYLQELGINTLWLIPAYKYNSDGNLGSGGPYGVLDFYEIDKALGGLDHASSFVNAAHSKGMKVLFDIVPTGGWVPELLEKQEWHVFNEHGVRDKGPWNTAMPDYANQEYQTYIHDVVVHWITELGIDGYRIDVPGCCPPNWSSKEHRASYSTLGGAVGITKAVRSGILDAGKEPFVLPELHGYPAVLSNADASYGFEFFYFINNLVSSKYEPESWAREIVGWLQDEYYAMPAGSLKVRFLTNHDMTRDFGRPRVAYGSGLSNALMAVMTFSEGIPLVHHGQEVGASAYYSRLFKVRAAIPELTRGKPNYTGVKTTSGVAGWLRNLDGQNTVILVNLCDKVVQTEIKLPIDEMGLEKSKVYTIYDAMNDEVLWFSGGSVCSPEEMSSFNVALTGFGARVLVIREDSMLEDIKRELAIFDSLNDATEVSLGEPSGNKLILLEKEKDRGLYRISNGYYTARLNIERFGLLESVQVRDLPLQTGGTAVEKAAFTSGSNPSDASISVRSGFMSGNEYGMAALTLTKAPKVVVWRGSVSPGNEQADLSNAIGESEEPLNVTVTQEWKMTIGRRSVGLISEFSYRFDASGSVSAEWRVLSDGNEGIGYLKSLEGYLQFDNATHWLLRTRESVYHDICFNRAPNWDDSRKVLRDTFASGLRDTYLPHRLWESAIEPLDQTVPEIVIFNEDSQQYVLVHVDDFQGSSSVGNMYVSYGDNAPEQVSQGLFERLLSFVGGFTRRHSKDNDRAQSSLSFVASWYDWYCPKDPGLGYEFVHMSASNMSKDGELRFSFQLAIGESTIQSMNQRLEADGNYLHASGQSLHQLSGSSDDLSMFEDLLLQVRPITLGINISIETAGNYQIWLEARNSELSADGTDLLDRYELTMDAKRVEFLWDRLGVRLVGANAYMGWIRIPDVWLDPGMHQLTIRGLKDWVGTGSKVILTSDQRYRPYQ